MADHDDNGAAYLTKFGLTDDAVMALNPCLQGISVTNDDVIDIGKGLVNNWSLTSVDLGRCKINEVGAFALAEALYVNHTLKYLGLANNPQIGDTGCKALADALSANQTLEVIDLSYCGIGDYGALALAQCMEEQECVSATKKCGEVRAIQLEGNRISKPGAAALAAALAQSTKLRSLNVAGNRLREAGALALSHGIVDTQSLTHLNVSNNDINPVGCTALIEALDMNNTISAVSLGRNRIGPAVVSLAKVCNTNSCLKDVNIESSCISPDVAQEFAAQLTSPSLLSINLGENKLGNDGVRAICKALKGKCLRYIDLSHVGLTHEGVEHVCELINIAPKLQTLQLDGNNIGPEGIKPLAAALSQSTTIDSFNLGETCIGDAGVAVLTKAVANNHMLRVLDLSDVGMGNEGCIVLCDMLAKMRRVAELDLSNNNVVATAAALRALCSVFTNNADLLQINLAGNPIGDGYDGGLLTLPLAVEACGPNGLPQVEAVAMGRAMEAVSPDPERDTVRGSAHRPNANGLIFRPAWAPAIPPPKVYGDEQQKSIEDEDEELAEDHRKVPLVPEAGSLLHPYYPGYGRGRMANESHATTLDNTIDLTMYQSGCGREQFDYLKPNDTLFNKPIDRPNRVSPYSLQSLETNIGGLPITEEALRRKFNELDVDGNGYLDREEFGAIYSSFQNFGMMCTQQEVETMMMKHRVMDDGRVHFEEFAVIMLALARR
eukprot:TRINITY_DN1154_c1_g1_i1.p1 TRINITY_DN1154_c1_g1~~TRINITY_DN1154_c1_g1_i1.p1  ORF type:complete len:745 (+),score=320.23 TRINITY_DN1154_c1_g1_i1:73-2235(+)